MKKPYRLPYVLEVGGPYANADMINRDPIANLHELADMLENDPDYWKQENILGMMDMNPGLGDMMERARKRPIRDSLDALSYQDRP